MSGAHMAAHAAQKAKEELELEEMEMTKYTDQELAQEWEFKILRSSTNKFNKPQILQQVVAEEAIAGWVLVEKFDDKRLRFKRPMSARQKDMMLPTGVDPYRTQFGISPDALGATIALSIISLIGGLMLVLYFTGNLN